MVGGEVQKRSMLIPINFYYSKPQSEHRLKFIKRTQYRWAGHVARMGEERGCVGSLWGNRRERTTGET